MNRKEFYARRRVYRIMLGQDNDEYSRYPSQETGKYWSDMNQFEPSNPRVWNYIGSAVQTHAVLKFRLHVGRGTKEEFMAGAPNIFKKRHPKVNLP